MSDDEQDIESDATLLASLYLDEEATADERALVETDTDALAQVERLSEVRTVLGATVPLASLSDREAHIADALDVWERMSDHERSGEVTPSDGISAAAAAALSTPSTGSRANRPDRRRNASGLGARQWLLSAAAGLTLIVGAGFVLRSLTADDADTSEVAVDEAPDDPVTELGDLEADEAAEVNGENVGSDVAPDASDLSDEASGSGLFPEDAASDRTAAADESAPAAEQPGPPPEEETFEIDNPDDLAIYASLAIPSLESGPSANDDIDFEPVFGSCAAELGVEQELEPIIYSGTPAVVGIDVDNRIVLAYTADDCNIVETAPLIDDTERGADIVDDTTP